MSSLRAQSRCFSVFSTNFHASSLQSITFGSLVSCSTTSRSRTSLQPRYVTLCNVETRRFILSYSTRSTRVHCIMLTIAPSKLAFSAVPGSLVSAVIGAVVGQIYRADLFSLKTYQIPPWLIRLSSNVAPYVIGSTRPPRRTNRALHEGSRASSTSVPPARAGGISDEDEGPITTARQSPSSTTRGGRGDNSRGGTTTSVMRDWVNELTGRDRTSPGLRIPSEAEITQVLGMFPNVGRETVVGVMQRRYARGFHSLPVTLCFAIGEPCMGVTGFIVCFPTLPPPPCFPVILLRSETIADEPILGCKCYKRRQKKYARLALPALPQKVPSRPF